MSSLSPYVLVAEPHGPTARALTAALTQATGLPCEVAADGHAAHELLLGRGVPRGLVTNLVLARRDGFALMRSLRKLDRERQVPIVAYAAQPQFCRTAESYRVELGPMQVLDGPPPPKAVVRALGLPTGSLASPPPPAPVHPTAAALAADHPTQPAFQAAAGHPTQPAFRLSDPSRPTEPAIPVAVALKPPMVLPPAPRSPTSPALREATRLARIESMQLADHAPPDADLQRLVDDVARSFKAPSAAITVLLENKLLLKAQSGLPDGVAANNEVPRSATFCQHVVEGGAPIIIPDAREHPVFADTPAVSDGHVVGYAGAPLITSHGDILGALCVTDTNPLDLGPRDVERLQQLARRMTGELELRAARTSLSPPPSYEPISLLPMSVDEPSPPPWPPRAAAGPTAPSPGAPPPLPPRATTVHQGATTPSPGVAAPSPVMPPRTPSDPVREAVTSRPASPQRPVARRATSEPATQDAPPLRPTLRSDAHRSRTAPGIGPTRDEEGNLVLDEAPRRADTRPEGIRPRTGSQVDILEDARKQAETVPAPQVGEHVNVAATDRNAATVPVGPQHTSRPASGELAQRRLVLSALQAAMASLPCAVLVFDSHRRTLFANDACCRFFEVAPGGLTGISRTVILARLSDRLLEPEDAMSRLAVPPEGPFALHERLPLRDPPGSSLCWSSAPLPLVGGEVQVASISEA